VSPVDLFEWIVCEQCLNYRWNVLTSGVGRDRSSLTCVLKGSCTISSFKKCNQNVIKNILQSYIWTQTKNLSKVSVKFNYYGVTEKLNRSVWTINRKFTPLQILRKFSHVVLIHKSTVSENICSYAYIVHWISYIRFKISSTFKEQTRFPETKDCLFVTYYITYVRMA
jgi:hypothetical protein